MPAFHANDFQESNAVRIKIKTRKKAKNSARTAWPAGMRWAAVGTLAAYSAVGSKTFTPRSATGAGSVASNRCANGVG